VTSRKTHCTTGGKSARFRKPAMSYNLFNPTKLHRWYLKFASNSAVVLITQRSFYDMFAYATWVKATLVRSVSVNPVGKVREYVGGP
jgi:hypothetical protein